MRPPADQRVPMSWVTSPTIRHALELCELYARIDRPIVFVGPVGVGKSTLAREAHRLSGRRGEYVARSCGELTETLFGDELFGRVPGAFTGASAPRPAVFREAADGTLLLDDLPLMLPGAQGSILRVLESGYYRPLGASRDKQATCRLMFASTADIDTLVDQGILLPDLASRLGEFIISVPPLRARPKDVMPIASAAAGDFVRELEASAVVTFSDEARALLTAYSWPQNVREIRNVMAYAVVHAGVSNGEVSIRPVHLPARLQTFEPIKRSTPRVTAALARSMLRQTNGNVSAAARELGVHRNTIHRKLKEAAG